MSDRASGAAEETSAAEQWTMRDDSKGTSGWVLEDTRALAARRSDRLNLEALDIVESGGESAIVPHISGCKAASYTIWVMVMFIGFPSTL